MTTKTKVKPTPDESNTGDNAQPAEKQHPIVTEEEDGSTKTVRLTADGTEVWEKKFKDGKRINLEEDGYTVTRHTNGTLEYKLRSGMNVTIRAGFADDVLKARRSLGTKHNQEMFMLAMMAELCRFDGKYMIPEDIGKKIRAGEYILLEGYFAEVNF